MKNPILLKLGANIRECRMQRQISQERLAELASLHRTYVGGIERGERNVSLLNIVRIARALDVAPERLLRGIR
jgi:transcriptional regulator with XRE-family HTH domain